MRERLGAAAGEVEVGDGVRVEDDGSGLSDDEVRNHMTTLFMGGFDTTAFGLTLRTRPQFVQVSTSARRPKPVLIRDAIWGCPPPHRT